MKPQRISLSWMVLFLTASQAIAQGPGQLPGPDDEHRWLQQFVGDWVMESTGTTGPGQPPMECSGTITSRRLGDFWVINEMKADLMETPMNGLQTIGYDPAAKKYVGTWVDSMTNFMWHYVGFVDESGKVLTLEADGPSFAAEGKSTKFQDIYKFKSDDEYAMESRMLGEDGKWVTFMTGTARRKK